VLKPHQKNKWYGFKAQRIGNAEAAAAAEAARATARNPETSKKYAAHPSKETSKGKSKAAASTSASASGGVGAWGGAHGKGLGGGYVDGDQAAEDMAAAVVEGLAKARRLRVVAKAEREARQDSQVLLPVDPEKTRRPVARGWLGVLAGEVELLGGGAARGVGEFGSVLVEGVSLSSGRWYYECELRTAGVMQVGWADTLFSGDSGDGDGVGDDAHSWAFDGCRQQKWTAGEGQEYGLAWHAGDVVGCMLDIDRGEISFSLNGQDMGCAYEGLVLAHALGSQGTTSTKGDSSDSGGFGFYPAAAAEDGEELVLHIAPGDLKFGPPPGFSAVTAQIRAASLAPSPTEQAPAPVLQSSESTVAEAIPSLIVPAATARLAELVPAAAVPAVPAAPVTAEELALESFTGPAELEALGLDRLKVFFT